MCLVSGMAYKNRSRNIYYSRKAGKKKKRERKKEVFTIQEKNVGVYD